MTSIRGAVIVDHRLGSTATVYAEARPGFHDYGLRTVNGIDYLGAAVDIMITTTLPLSSARDALRTQLSAQMPGIMVYDTYPGVIAPPCVVIAPDRGDYQLVLGMTGPSEYPLLCTALVRFVDNPSAQDALAALINAT